MTTPALSFGIRKRGRHYPTPPVDPSPWPRNRWGSVDPEDVPPDIEPAPSITNVCGLFGGSGDGLLYWAEECGIRDLYARGALPLDVETAYQQVRGSFDRARKQRSEAGTRAHTLAETLTSDLPLPSSVSDEDAAYADGFMQFWADHDPTPILTEATVYGDGYAGTGDLFCDIAGTPTVVDYKTRGERKERRIQSTGDFYDKDRMQLAALAAAPEVATEVAAGEWKLEPAPEALQGAGVILYPDGTYHVEWLDWSELERWLSAFEGALKVWRAVHEGVPA